MKRPAGFDRPAPPEQPRAARASGRAADRTGERTGQRRPADPPAPKRDGAPRGAGAAPERPTRADEKRPAKAPARKAPEREDGVAEAARTVKAAAAAERRARRELRRATRARKRMERAEVRRFTGRRRRARTTALVAAGSVAVLVGVVAIGVFSPVFALREVRVEGASRVPPEQIVDIVDDQLGTPLPQLDFEGIERGLGAIPLIRSYATESRPPGTLVVRVVERTLLAVLARGEGFELVDSAGVVVETGSERMAGYPLIELPDGDVAAVPFTAAAEVLVALPADLLAQVDSISARTVDDVTLVLASGQRVVWGDASDSVRKAQHLSRLLAQQPTTVAEYDVSSAGVGIIRGG